MTRHLAPLFALCLAASCGSPTAVVPDFSLGQPFWLSSGQEALSTDGTTLVRVTRVSDSLCRPGMVCIWEGEVVAEVSVRVADVGEPATATLHSRLEPRTVALDAVGRTISLLEVGGSAGDGPQNARFRLKFVVTRSDLR